MWLRRVRLEEGGKVVVLSGVPGRRRLRRRIFWYGFEFLVLLSVFGIVIYGSFVKADALKFYPSSCLGTWAGVDNVLGRPDLSMDASLTNFTDSNSASLINPTSQVFCGNFKELGETSLDDKDFKEAILRIVWRYVPPQDPAPSLPQVLDVLLPSASSSSVEDSFGEASSSSSSSSSAAASTEVIEIPKEPEEKPEEPVGWRWLNTAFAQEQSESSTQIIFEDPKNDSSTELLVQSSSSGEEATLEIPFELNIADTVIASSSEGSTARIQDPSVDTIEISYSVDGEEWRLLSEVVANQAEPTMFLVPIKSWEELHSFQISIRPRLKGSEVPPIKLDGFELEVTYRDKVPYAEPDPVPLDTSGIKIDPMAAHYCSINPFELELRENSVATATIDMIPSGPDAVFSRLTFGSLPPGIEGSIIAGNATSGTLSLAATKRFRGGSYNSVIFYEETKPDNLPSVAICQFNLMLFE